VYRDIWYLIYLVIAWNVFRVFFQMPIVLDELWFKPLIFLVPLWLVNHLAHKKERISFFAGNLSRSVFFGLLVGLCYFVIYGGDLNWIGMSIVLAMVIAITEELTVSGFVGANMIKRLGLLPGLIVTGFASVFLRTSVVWLWWGGLYVPVIWGLLLVFISTMINALLFYKTKNIWSSILARFGSMMAVM
jgi:hypothetical protein